VWRKNLRQLGDERAAGQDPSDTECPRFLNRSGVDVRNEAKRWDRAQLLVRSQSPQDLEGLRPGAIEIQQDQRGSFLLRCSDGRIGSGRRTDSYAGLFGHRRDLRAKQQVIRDDKNHHGILHG